MMKRVEQLSEEISKYKGNLSKSSIISLEILRARLDEHLKTKKEFLEMIDRIMCQDEDYEEDCILCQKKKELKKEVSNGL